MVGDMIKNRVFQEILMDLVQKNINKIMVAEVYIAKDVPFMLHLYMPIFP